MLTIRFSRVGKKNRAYYRVVLTENSAPVKGRFTELLGSYDPHSKQAVLKTERILHWAKEGAVFSDSVHNLLIKEGILKGSKKAIKMEKPKKKEAVADAQPAEVKESAQEVAKEEKKEPVEKAPIPEEKVEPKEAPKEPVEEEKK